MLGKMLDKIVGKPETLLDGIKMFQFVLFTCRPLTVIEFLHALGIRDNFNLLSDESFEKYIPRKQRITHCGGNFLEIREVNGITTSYKNSPDSQTNKSAGNQRVQIIHHTVREFFLRSDGYVASSKFRIGEKDAHNCIFITCIRYLMLCAANTTLAKTLPDIESWTSKHFKDYAQYLDRRPFANYALRYLKHHMDGCHQDVNALGMTSQFIDKLTYPAVYLLEGWVSSHLNKTLLNNEESAAENFRNKVLLAAVWNGFSTAAEMLLIIETNANA